MQKIDILTGLGSEKWYFLLKVFFQPDFLIFLVFEMDAILSHH